MVPSRQSKPGVVFLFIASSILTHVLGELQPTLAAGTSGSSSEATSSSQPLWSYQVKPNSYANIPGVQGSQYPGSLSAGYSAPSIFDTLNGLSQRQGALSGSPFLSILPIILIAAGGMLLLLPFLTMMMASPFGGGFGGYNSNFGYPQVGVLNKKRSLGAGVDGKGLIDLIEHVSSSIEELTKKYSPLANGLGSQRRAKLSSPNNHQGAATLAGQSSEVSPQNSPPNNHRTNGETSGDNIVNNNSLGNGS